MAIAKALQWRSLEYGSLRYVLAYARCGQCGHKLLIALSCKCRSFCPSTSARCMVATAALGQQQKCSHGAESGRSTPLLPVAYPETAIRSLAGGSGAQWKGPLDGGVTPNARSALQLRCFATVSTTPGRGRGGDLPAAIAVEYGLKTAHVATFVPPR